MTTVSALEVTFIYNGQPTNVPTYFQQRYGIPLQFPKWPLAVAAKKVNGNKAMYPLELLFVADNQRVTQANITPQDIATIVKVCFFVILQCLNFDVRQRGSLMFGEEGKI